MATNPNALILAPRDDPALLGWPPTLPIEIALRVAPIKKICEAYDITKEEFERLRLDQRFVDDVRRADEMVRKEGMTFKLKAQLQADELLQTAWKMIHSPTDAVPAVVRADLIKFIIRCAGLDASKDQANNHATSNQNLQININL